MTPLISEMSRLVPDPETAHWFDLGDVANHVPAAHIEWDKVWHMPYQRTACVFQTTETHTKYAVMLLTGDHNITVAYIAFDPGKSPIHSRPISVLEVDGELVYKVSGKAPKDDANVKKVMRVLAVVAQRIHGERISYAPTLQGTPAQQAKRKRHGKAPLFSWHTVNITAQEIASAGLGGHHASPRLHDRRGHFRKHPSGKKVWVKSCKVGKASLGVVFKDYKVSL